MSDDDTINASTPATDTGAPTPAPQDTSVPTTPEPQNAAPTNAPTGTAAPGLSQPQNAVQNNGQDPAQPAVDWQKRYTDLQSFNDRRFQAMQQQQREYQQKLEQFTQQQKQAEAAKQAMPWQKSSPQHQQFRSVVERSKAIEKQVQAAQQIQDPAQREVAMNAIAAGISDEEKTQLAQFREQQREFQSNFFSDPEGTLAPVLEKAARQVFETMRSEIQGRMRVDQDFDSPHLKPILENPQYAGYLQEKLSKGLPYEDAMEMVKLRAAADMMYQRSQGQQSVVAAAQEQQRLAKGRAANVVSPDPVSAPQDPYVMAKKEAAKLGIQPGTPKFNDLITKYTVTAR